jgi:hypothetical protein
MGESPLGTWAHVLAHVIAKGAGAEEDAVELFGHLAEATEERQGGRLAYRRFWQNIGHALVP